MTFDRHLVLREITVPAGSEWAPPWPGWTVVRLEAGIGYWRGRDSDRELTASDVVVLSPQADGIIRASRLGPVQLQFFCVQPELLGGILTGPERVRLCAAAAESQAAARFIRADDPIARRFLGLRESGCVSGLWFRCQLLQLWAEVFARELTWTMSGPTQWADAKERFQQLIHRMPEAELRACSIDDLARVLRCSPRHMSRLFREVFGVSFRARRTELRSKSRQAD